ncbi:MAG: hypothetical protein ACSHYF_10255 [Verrucomicrobiaceae bacterium]
MNANNHPDVLRGILSGILLLLPVELTADYSVFFQQGSPVRVNGRAIPLIYEDGQDAEIREADAGENFDGGTGGPDGVEGPFSAVVMGGDEPEGSGMSASYLLKFEEILSGKYVPVPAAHKIVGAYLIFDFVDIGDELEMQVNAAAWSEETVTWDNFGSAGDGVSGADATPVRDVMIYGPNLVIDVTGEVLGWAGGAVNEGWSFLPTGADNAVLKSNHLRDPDMLGVGAPVFIPTGLWGVRDEEGVFKKTDAMMLNEESLGAPGLLIYFEPEEGFGPGFGVGSVAGPPPGGPPAGPGGGGPAGGDPGGGGPGGGGPGGGGPGGGAGQDGGDFVFWWYGWPDTKQSSELSEDFETWGEEEDAFEAGPGCFVRRVPIGDKPKRFGRKILVDGDGDGAPDRKGGVSGTRGEDCPENALADLFVLVEQTGRTLREKDEEFNRTAHAQNLRILEFIYTFTENYAVGTHAVPFDRAVRGFLGGDKNLLPILPNGQLNFANVTPHEARNIMKDAVAYIRYLTWWQLVYYSDPWEDEEKDILRQCINDLAGYYEQLCALNQNNANFMEQLVEVQRLICQKFQQARSQTGHPFATIAAKLFTWVGKKGVWGLFKVMLADNFGKSFLDGTLKAVKGVADTVMELISGVSTLLTAGEFEEAQCKFNEALCALVDAANGMPKFQLMENQVLNYELLHASSVHEDLHSTVLEPLMVCYDPTAGPGGKGAWVTTQLTVVNNKAGEGRDDKIKIKTYLPGVATGDGTTKVTETYIDVPNIEAGQKCYLVLNVRRIFKNETGGPGREKRQSYFVGVIQNG